MLLCNLNNRIAWLQTNSISVGRGQSPFFFSRTRVFIICISVCARRSAQRLNLSSPRTNRPLLHYSRARFNYCSEVSTVHQSYTVPGGAIIIFSESIGVSRVLLKLDFTVNRAQTIARIKSKTPTDERWCIACCALRKLFNGKSVRFAGRGEHRETG